MSVAVVQVEPSLFTRLESGRVSRVVTFGSLKGSFSPLASREFTVSFTCPFSHTRLFAPPRSLSPPRARSNCRGVPFDPGKAAKACEEIVRQKPDRAHPESQRTIAVARVSNLQRTTWCTAKPAVVRRAVQDRHVDRVPKNSHSFGHSPTSALGTGIFSPVLAAPPQIDFRLAQQDCSIYYYCEEH